ncbi:MAG: rubrerythrin family protein [Nitrososphaeria archaeon]|nr:rubrerythrin family protein [Nitrososphaeria archaeon]NIN53110.1 rubrerythrin family protein [Nitrososphaeria archaeon]NIQ33876.1 rubrerythrin family protein [Nitrososphaeria archaeon]
MTKTEENLRAAFAGESQANRRYLAFAERAEREGYPEVSRLFRAAAESETVHALFHLRIMKEVKSTKENLETAITGETYEYEKMYPEFIEVAQAEGNKAAVRSFSYAKDVEIGHAERYKEGLESVKDGRDLEPTDYFVCQICGYIVAGETLETCPICGSPREKFKTIG